MRFRILDRMKVLMTVGFLGHFGETDGVVTTYRNLLPFFERSGLEVDVVAYGPRDRTFREGGVRYHVHRPRLPVRVDPVRWIDAGFSGTRLGRELAQLRYDVVQSSTPDPLGLWAAGVARRQRCPFLAFYHTALAEYASIRGRQSAGPLGGWLLGGAMKAWLRRYFDRADGILAPSESVRATVAARQRPPVVVLSRGVDSETFHPRRRRRPTGRVRALYVGRMTPEKNLEMLVPLFSDREDVELTVVGDGPSLEGMRRRLPRASFTGRLEGDALAETYADADLFVFPSRTDTLGNVVLEAMASGLPVVVTDAMGPKELVSHGVTGFVAATDEAFANAVLALAGNGDLRRTMASAARRYAETRSWSAIFEQLLAEYGRARVLFGDSERRPALAAATARSPARAAARPLCVLDITEFFGETSGGVKTYLTQKARYVHGRTDVRQVVVVPGESDSRVDDARVRWYRVRGPRIPTQRPYRFMIDGEQIRAIVEQERPDLIEVGSHFIAPWLIADIARATGTPVVWFCHSNLPRILAPYAWSAWVRRQAAAASRRYMRSLSRRCASTFAPSDALAADLENIGVQNVRRVSLGVEASRFDPVRRARARETRRRMDLPDGPLALYAGRITSEKGVDILLEAWPRVEEATGAHLALVGDGPGLGRLRARSRGRRVHWRSYEADPERLADLMASVDLYVAPSVVETFGLAALEAMSCGTPVLSADCGAVADHVSRSGAGAVFDSGSAESLSHRAVQLLGRGLSALGQRGHAYVSRQLSWTSAFDGIFSAYEMILCGQG